MRSSQQQNVQRTHAAVGVLRLDTPAWGRALRVWLWAMIGALALSQTAWGAPSDSEAQKLRQERKIVHQYYRQSLRFRYRADEDGFGGAPSGPFPSDYWQLPQQTERVGEGDCEDFSVWLYVKLLDAGLENVRLFIGKHTVGDAAMHAWVMWFPKDKAYILDPTMRTGIFEAKSYPSGKYQPFFSFHRSRKWYHYPGVNRTGG